MLYMLSAKWTALVAAVVLVAWLLRRRTDSYTLGGPGKMMRGVVARLSGPNKQVQERKYSMDQALGVSQMAREGRQLSTQDVLVAMWSKAYRLTSSPAHALNDALIKQLVRAKFDITSDAQANRAYLNDVASKQTKGWSMNVYAMY